MPFVLPLRLNREQFEKLFPAERGRTSYTYDQRSTLGVAATGYRGRQATGRYFYTNPLVPDRAGDTAKQAQEMGWRRYQELEEAEWHSIAQSETTVIK